MFYVFMSWMFGCLMEFDCAVLYMNCVRVGRSARLLFVYFSLELVGDGTNLINTKQASRFFSIYE